MSDLSQEIKIRPLGEITHQMSVYDPEKYRQRLLVNLGSHNQRCHKFSLRLREVNLLNEESIELNPQSPYSSCDADSSRLTLGTQEFLKEELARRLYRGETLSYPQEKTYMITHELMHKLFLLTRRMDKNNPAKKSVDQIFDTAKQPRGSDKHLGLTANGSEEHYADQTTTIQAVEDCVELGTMWLFQPEVLENYFQDLSDSRLGYMRRKHGLATLSPDQSRSLLNTLNNWMQSSLE